MEKSNYNYGIGILRIFFCYMVISFHFYGVMNLDNRFYFLRELAVPMFVLISFYFGYRVITSNDREKYWKRGVRLFVPYLFWGIIGYIGLWIVSFFTAIPHASIRDLIMQIAFGSNDRLNAPLWFQWEIIVLTILFILLYKIFKKYTSIVLVVLMVVCYIVQYTNINLYLYTMMPYELYNDIGRFFEVLPLASVGFIIADIKVIDKLENKRWLSVVFLILAIICIIFVERIPTPFITFAYAGVKHLIVATLLFLSFYLIPFEKLPDSITKIIKWLASYTMGIYFIHWMVGKVCDALWMSKFGVQKTLLETFVIFVLCLIICVIIDKIPIKYSSMLVR